MNRLQLEAIFNRENVSKVYYSFDGPGGGDTLALEDLSEVWTLSYYSERGGRIEKATFATEDEGCRAFFTAVARDVREVEHRTISI